MRMNRFEYHRTRSEERLFKRLDEELKWRRVAYRINFLYSNLKEVGFTPERIILGFDLFRKLIDELNDTNPYAFPPPLTRSQTQLSEYHGCALIVTATEGQLEVLPGNEDMYFYAEKFISP